MTPEECIDLFGSLKAKDDRRRAYFETQKPTTNNKKAGQTEDVDARSELIPRVTHKKHNRDSKNKKQHNTNIHHVSQCSCVLFKKAGCPYCMYKYHYSDNFNAFYSKNTMNHLYRYRDKCNAAAKQFRKKKKIHRSRWRPWRRITRCCSSYSRKPAPIVIWTRQIRSRRLAATTVASLATYTLVTLISNTLAT